MTRATWRRSRSRRDVARPGTAPGSASTLLPGPVLEVLVLSSLLLSWVLTSVFVLTGAYALVRLAALHSGAAVGCDRLAELSHLLMSIAMIAMVWAWSGGPESPSGIVQLVVFGLLGLCFLTLVLQTGPGRTGNACHALMAGAMVWMVAAMPLVMGAMPDEAAGGGAHAGRAGHGGGAMPEMTPPGDADAAPWAVAVSGVLVAALACAAVFWAARALRSRPVPAAAGRAPRTSSGGVALTAAPAPVVVTRISLLADPRAAAVCHGLMSVGMAAMLAAML